jgi:hypothetical protein
MTNPFSWLKGIHEAVYREETPLTVTNNSNPSHTHSYTAGGNYNPVGLTNSQAAQIYTTNITGIGGGISSIPNQYLSQYPAAQGIGISGLASVNSTPNPTGVLVSIAFIDANGQTWCLTIDQAYAQIMAQISQYHSYRSMSVAQQAPNPWPTPAPSKMVDGDFSFDEMEEAELLILELEGGRDNSHSQDQEAISASQA